MIPKRLYLFLCLKNQIFTLVFWQDTKKITKPSKILSKLHNGIVALLHQNSDDLSNQDGMELSLCVYDKKSKILEYSGAMTPAYIIKNKEIFILVPDEFAIGGIDAHDKSIENICFTDKQIQIFENDILYMFSDGFVDQFGGEENIKFNIPRFNPHCSLLFVTI